MASYIKDTRELALALWNGAFPCTVLMVLLLLGFGAWAFLVLRDPEKRTNFALVGRGIQGFTTGAFAIALFMSLIMGVPYAVAVSQSHHNDLVPRLALLPNNRSSPAEGLEPDPVPFLILAIIAVWTLPAGDATEQTWKRYVKICGTVGAVTFIWTLSTLIHAFMLYRANAPPHH